MHVLQDAHPVSRGKESPCPAQESKLLASQGTALVTECPSRYEDHCREKKLNNENMGE